MATWSLRQVVCLSIVLAALVGLGMKGCTTVQWMDAVTGSRSVRTIGPLGIPLGTRVEVSALEKRLKRMGVAWVADWRFLSEEQASLLGASRGCGNAPEIYPLTSEMKAFVEAATDQEIREFVRVMQAGTPAEQRAAVRAAEEKGLEAMKNGG
jgi:hypothetical protein